jgi:NAD(P)-dependent dehydrogenase (short-subunit alcohol dehydrogenase family)
MTSYLPGSNPPAVDRLVKENGITPGNRGPESVDATSGEVDALTTVPETLRLMLDVNLGPALWLSWALTPHMQQQGSIPGPRTHGIRVNAAAPQPR